MLQQGNLKERKAMWIILLCHLIGDFILQTDKMATQKKIDWKVCLLHVCVYMIPLVLFSKLGVVALLLIAVQHYIQDRTGFVKWFMVNTGSKEFAKHFWAMVAVDQIFHVTWITLVVKCVNI